MMVMAANIDNLSANQSSTKNKGATVVMRPCLYVYDVHARCTCTTV